MFTLYNKIRTLSKRETEVLQLKLEGLMDKQIADRLCIKYGTVRNHIDKAKLKLQTANTIQLAYVLKEAGLIQGKY